METEDRSRIDRGFIVTAAIVDRHDRVLVIQRSGDDWTLPGGELDARQALGFRLRHCVRRATGFEVEAPSVVGVYDVDAAVAILVRCRISGVGSDITSDTRSMRWMDRATIRAEMAPAYVEGLLDALDSGCRRVPVDPAIEPATALAS